MDEFDGFDDEWVRIAMDIQPFARPVIRPNIPDLAIHTQ